MPTELERRSDFSETRESDGELYNLIYNPASGLPKSACSSTDTSACFRDGGVLGRIPLSRLYGPGLALLSQYPMPTVGQPSGQSYNYSITSPIQTTLAYIPVIRIDYQVHPRVRLTGKWTARTRSCGRPSERCQASVTRCRSSRCHSTPRAR